MSTSFNFANKENATHLSRGAPKTPSNSKSIIFKNNNNNNNNNNNSHNNSNNSIPKKIPVLKDGFKTPNNKVEQKNAKRIPLGGKDKNSNNVHNAHNPLIISAGSLNDNHHQIHAKGLTSSASKRRIRRLRTPLSNMPASKKLNVLRDEPAKSENMRVIDPVEFDDEIEYVPEKEPELPYLPLNYEPFTEEELNTLKNYSNPRTFDCSDEVTPLTQEEILEEYPISFDDLSDNGSDSHSVTSVEKKTNPHFMEPTFVSNARFRNKKVEVYDDGLTSAELQRMIDEE